MKKHKYLLTFLLILLFPIYVNADCTNEELKHFREIESEYRLEYELNKTTGRYKLIMYNPEPHRYTYTITGIENYPLCSINPDADTVCEFLGVGSYKITVVGNTNTCTDTLKREFITLKKYNKYSEDPLCEDIKEFSLCQETYDKEIDYETFVLRVQAYKESKSQEQSSSKKKIDISKIQEYLENNLFQVIVVAVFVILVIITVIVTITTSKKSRRLE